MSQSISVIVGDERSVINPVNRLSRNIFNIYLGLCNTHGCEYDNRLQAQVVSLDKVPTLIDSLKENGFDVQVHGDLPTDTPEDDTWIEHRQSLLSSLEGHDRSPFDYQWEGIKYLHASNSAALFDDMGTGKTVQTLCAIPFAAQGIVVCPAVMKAVWADECSRWRSDLSPTLLSGRGSFRWPKLGELVIINWDIIPKPSTKSRPGEKVEGLPLPGTTIVFDECHAAKSPKAARTTGARKIAKRVSAKDGNVWLLSGTPLINHPLELYNVLKLANLHDQTFGSWNKFVSLFNGERTGFGGAYQWGTPKREAGEKLKGTTLRRTLEEVQTQIPPIRFQNIRVDIGAQTKKQCDKVMHLLEDSGISIEDAISRSLSSKDKDMIIQEMSQARQMLAIAKIPAMMELVDGFREQEEKLVVFSSVRAPIEALSKLKGWGVILGGISDKKRKETVDDFQSGKLSGVGLTISAGGVGITLTEAANAIFVDSSYSPAMNSQAIGRIRRTGQDRPQLIKWLVADHVMDRMVQAAIRRKMRTISSTGLGSKD